MFLLFCNQIKNLKNKLQRFCGILVKSHLKKLDVLILELGK